MMLFICLPRAFINIVLLSAEEADITESMLMITIELSITILSLVLICKTERNQPVNFVG